MNVQGIGFYRQTAGIGLRKTETQAEKSGLGKLQIREEKKESSFLDKVTISKEGKEAQKNMLAQGVDEAGPLARIQSRQGLQQGMKTGLRTTSTSRMSIGGKDIL